MPYNGKVYFGCKTGKYYVINDADKSLILGWPYGGAGGNANTGPWIDVGNSRVIFGTTSGDLDAFTLE